MISEQMLALDRTAIRRCMADVDVVGVIRRALREHAAGRTSLPPEGYLPWVNGKGAYSRSLAMLGAISDDHGDHRGVKIINAATSNPELGLERAGGVVMLFHPETARPMALADAAMISAMRTAAYTMVSLDVLGPVEPSAVSIIGCGALARAHLELLARGFPSVTRAHVTDLRPERAEALAAWATERKLPIEVHPVTAAAACVGLSDVLITVTVSDTPYIAPEWFTAPTFVAHVSLDDVTPEVFTSARAVYVDDLSLVVENPRRTLGGMLADGRIIAGPGDGTGPHILGTLGAVLDGAVPALRPGPGHIVSNPFGMAILDVVLAAAVHRRAMEEGLGFTVDLSE